MPRLGVKAATVWVEKMRLVICKTELYFSKMISLKRKKLFTISFSVEKLIFVAFGPIFRTKQTNVAFWAKESVTSLLKTKLRQFLGELALDSFHRIP